MQDSATPGTAPRPTIRDAGPDDISLLNSLAHQIWWACYRGMIPDEQIRFMLDWMYSPERIRTSMAEGTRWEIAELDSAPIAYLSWTFSGQDKIVHLHKLYLAPAFHGRGFGQLLLDHIRTAGRELGAASVQLRVNRQNLRAQRAYRLAGFIHSHDLCEDIGNGFVMDDHVFILPLK